MENVSDQEMFAEFLDYIKMNHISYDHNSCDTRLFAKLAHVLGPQAEMMQCVIENGMWKFFVGSRSTCIPHNQLITRNLM